MKNTWIRPDFDEIGVGGECTAYAGAAPSGSARVAGEHGTQVVPAQPGSPTARREETERR
jgi:hypothetical protein